MSTKVTKRRGPGRPPGSKNRIKPKKLARKGYKINNKPVKAISLAVGLEVKAPVGRGKYEKGVIVKVGKFNYLVGRPGGLPSWYNKENLTPTGRSLRVREVKLAGDRSVYVVQGWPFVHYYGAISIKDLTDLIAAHIYAGNIKPPVK
jgi:hypothetical protein